MTKAYNQAAAAAKANILRDALVIHLHSVTPPDRVGVIRRLRWNLSLRKEPDGSFVIDTTKQRHKSKQVQRLNIQSVHLLATSCLGTQHPSFTDQP